MLQRIFIKQDSKDSDDENVITTSMGTWYMGNRWHKSDLDLVTSDVYTFVPPRHQYLCPG